MEEKSSHKNGNKSRTSIHARLEHFTWVRALFLEMKTAQII
jgi:hypothetical protein